MAKRARRTKWYPHTILPVRAGWYERDCRVWNTVNGSFQITKYWFSTTTKKWHCERDLSWSTGYPTLMWRGLREKA